MFQEDFEITEEKTTHNESKRIKEELQHGLDSRKGTTTWSPKPLQKRKNTFEDGKGSEQGGKSGEDAR